MVSLLCAQPTWSAHSLPNDSQCFTLCPAHAALPVLGSEYNVF